MLLTVEQMRLIASYEAGEDLTPKQKKQLKSLDEFCFELYGEHVVTNYEKL